MPQISLAKVSGVLVITQTAGAGKYYAATSVANAKFYPNSAGTGVSIFVGGDPYEIAITDLSVNGQTPTTISTALTLLNSIFGS